jgi:hypothetical protein
MAKVVELAQIVIDDGSPRVMGNWIDNTRPVLATKVNGSWTYQCSEELLPAVREMIDLYEKVMVRPEVWEFARSMELKLRASGGKSSWKGISREYLTKRMIQEVVELLAALGIGAAEIQLLVSEQIRQLDAHDYASSPSAEAVDVANFAMMLYDNLTNHRI